MSSPALASNKSPFRHELKARLVPIERLRPFPRQLRRYPATQIRKLAKSVDSFGFVLPIVIDEKDR